MASKSKKLEKGFVISAHSTKYRIAQIIDTATIIARRFDNGVSEKLSTDEICILDQSVHHDNELVAMPDSAWKKAQENFLAIKPLLDLDRRTAEDVKKRAQQVGVHDATLYRWIKSYERTGKTSALAPAKRLGGKGKSRLNDEVETKLNHVIQTFYLKQNRPSVPKTIRTVLQECKKDGINPPGVNTIRARIKAINEKKRLGSRHGFKIATEKFGAYPGKFNDAKFLLSVIQI